MEGPDFDDLIIPPQRRWKPKGKKEREVFGYDTETVDGKVYLICDSQGGVCYPRHGMGDLIEFLFKYSKRSRLNVTFNLRYDFQAIVKLLPSEKLIELWQEGAVEVGGLRISFIPKKLFVIRDKHRHSIRLYDVAQFYEGMSLDRASRFYLGKAKGKFNVHDPTPALLDTEKARKYCVHDSRLAAELGELVMSKLKDLGVKGPELISPAYISEQFFRQNCYIPQIDKIPRGALRYAFNSYRGGWFEGFKRGYFPEAYEYDINSAYPDKIRGLIDVTKGRWEYRKGGVPHPSEGAAYGYVQADVMIPPALYISPMMLRMGYVCKNPVGNFRRRYFTLKELEAIQATNDFTIVEPVDGWYYFPEMIFYPFRQAVEALYRKKQEVKGNDPAMYLVVKKILNSLYGKFWQKVKKRGEWIAGNFFNPFYATEITARTRLQIYRAARKAEARMIGIATDSIITDAALPIDRTDKLGAFSFQGAGKLVNIMGGIRTMELDGGNEIKSRFRGFAGGRVNFFDLLRRHPGRDEIPFKIRKVVSLGEIVAFNKMYSPDDLNRFVEIEKTLDLNSDVKRAWPGRVTSDDLLSGVQDSEPLFYYER